MTMCFNKEPGAAEVEVSVLMSASAVVYIYQLCTSGGVKPVSG